MRSTEKFQVLSEGVLSLVKKEASMKKDNPEDKQSIENPIKANSGADNPPNEDQTG